VPSKPVISAQVTVWDDPSEPVLTTCGKVHYSEWLASESDRIGGCEVRSGTNEMGRPVVALFRDVSYFNLRQEA
jgi:hypothetical protein